MTDAGVAMVRKLMSATWAGATVLMLAAVGACLWLCRWQWGRFESATGSWQNLAYTFQWPVFAAFCVYAWWWLLRDAAAGHHDRGAAVLEPGGDQGAEPAGGPPAGAQDAPDPVARRGGLVAGLDEAELAALPQAARRRARQATQRRAQRPTDRSG